MHWEQHLVSSETDIARAMFEMNRPGLIEGEDFAYCKPEDVNKTYIRECAESAIQNLEAVVAALGGKQQLFDFKPMRGKASR